MTPDIMTPVCFSEFDSMTRLQVRSTTAAEQDLVKVSLKPLMDMAADSPHDECHNTQNHVNLKEF